MNHQFKSIISFLFLFSILCSCKAQKIQTVETDVKQTEELPYFHNIPEYPDDYSEKNVAARMVDGLGFRLYWATKDLTETDLNYKPSETGRTTMETMVHLKGLCEVVYNTVINEPNIRSKEVVPATYEELREQALDYLKKASDVLKAKDGIGLEEMEVKFQRGDKTSAFPFWNLLNGPLADAMWHCGQVVMLRRAAGNPMESGVNVFMGTKKE